MFDSNNLPEEIEFNDVRFIKNEEELEDAVAKMSINETGAKKNLKDALKICRL